MSTVQNILDRIDPRIGTYPDIYWAFNNAVRAVAKRLYVLDSDLTKTDFKATFEVEEPYVDLASDYTDFWSLSGRPYVNGETSEMTPVPSQQEVLEYQPVIEDVNQGAMSYSGNTFTDAGQDFDDWDGEIYKLVVLNDDGTYNWCYIGSYATGDTTTANLFKDNADFETAGWYGTDPAAKTPSSYEVQSQTTTIDAPWHYEIIGTKLYVYPIWGYTAEDPDTPNIVLGKYFAKPTELTDTTDTIPYRELFDDVIEETIVRLVRGGFTGPSDKADPVLVERFVAAHVDRVISMRSPIPSRGMRA